jgi:hypothetical protein
MTASLRLVVGLAARRRPSRYAPCPCAAPQRSISSYPHNQPGKEFSSLLRTQHRVLVILIPCAAVKPGKRLNKIRGKPSRAIRTDPPTVHYRSSRYRALAIDSAHNAASVIPHVAAP